MFMRVTYLCAAPDWRWMLHRSDSPWYPTMRLFRQERLDEWTPVFERMASELRGLVRDRASQVEPQKLPAVLVEVSAGELIDKLTILQIKAERISDPQKLAHVTAELNSLQAARDARLSSSPELERFSGELRGINGQLWDVEAKLRWYEARSDFGSDFVELARSVYRLNDRRSELKRSINQLLGSRIIDEKSY